MRNDISAIKQLRLHAPPSQTSPFIHGAVNLCLRQKFNFDAAAGARFGDFISIKCRQSATSFRLIETLKNYFLSPRAKKDLKISPGLARG